MLNALKILFEIRYADTFILDMMAKGCYNPQAAVKLSVLPLLLSRLCDAHMLNTDGVECSKLRRELLHSSYLPILL